MVPALVLTEGDQQLVLSESLPICEYFEEMYPHLPRLLPNEPIKRWQVRRLCEQINASIQPVQNMSVIAEIGSRFGDDKKVPWV